MIQISAGTRRLGEIARPAPKPWALPGRIESIDMVRGVAMILMALDHVRDYVHFDSFLFSPTDLSRTTPALFATRLITHLCAPAFILLAGASAHFAGRRKTTAETSRFLLTRGAWLVLLQITVVRFAWNFDPFFRYNSSTILSTIGFSMIGLAVLVHFPRRMVLIFGLSLVIGHNAFDDISFKPGSALDVLWSFLHVRRLYQLPHGYSFSVLYPLVPWIGVMALGYCLGRMYDGDWTADRRRRALTWMGGASLAAFLLLRWLNVYGDPKPWAPQARFATTAMAFLDVEKYPPSLLYLCLTLGVTLLLLGLFEGAAGWRPVVTFGKVALFYYVIHLFAIHAFALVAVVSSGFPWRSMVFTGPQAQAPGLAGHYGFTLAETWVVWIVIVVLLYPLCAAWKSLKARHKASWWVSYV